MTRSAPGEYGSSRQSSGGTIASVTPGSAAALAGVEKGSTLLAVDGAPVADVIDWQWYSDGAEVTITLRDPAGVERDVLLVRGPGEPWGLEFDSVIFDVVRTCRNDCAFCFMAQLPKGMRPALYLRDDDFRLSFLSGNFVTLTNLSDADMTRIADQHLSPLYVSLHAVDPEVRSRLVCARGEDRALERFDELVEAGIDLHVQIVLVPGINDGPQLEATLTWLAEREGVLSVGIVPVGYTRHQSDITASYGDQIAAATVIEQVQRWQFAVRDRDGVTWVHLADEFYLNARAPLPRTEWYDDYPQFENGIGIVRSFVDDTLELRTRIEAALLALPADRESVTFVTGVMAATTLAGALEACEAVGRVRLLVVPNAFFGGNVSVTGLLTGADLLAAIQRDGHEGTYVVPDVVFNADGLTLDGMRREDLVEQSGASIQIVTSDAAGLLDAIERCGSGIL